MTVVTVFSNAVQKTKYHGDKNIVTIDTTVMGAEKSTEKNVRKREKSLYTKICDLNV